MALNETCEDGTRTLALTIPCDPPFQVARVCPTILICRNLPEKIPDVLVSCVRIIRLEVMSRIRIIAATRLHVFEHRHRQVKLTGDMTQNLINRKIPI